ncbi:hypothetical protein AQJ30_27460 [Streptomyces longwoodensis]|uniref:Uncharacterized protein n=1 Tax=Streptomyces longwoodensis TaxID=68231 RepID=A0A117QLH3_9ACTN|nr:hypothetical protein [Streptomyces longwoodensis]KUN34929.1 hypothetical protein AQJ30_27460 [Streptomyces longwoodensis]
MCGNAASGYLCNRHKDKLAARLRELPTLYREVIECLVPRRTGWGDIVASHAAAGPRSPINEDVIDTVNWARATEVIHSWRADVRRVRWPHREGTPPARLDDDCRWLAQELDWIVMQYPAAGDLAREVAELNSAVRSVVGDPEPRPQRIGYCVALVGEGIVCGAVISRMPGETRLTCGWCGTVYGPEDYLTLRHFQPDAA